MLALVNVGADQTLDEQGAQGGGVGGGGVPFSVDFSSCKLTPGYY